MAPHAAVTGKRVNFAAAPAAMVKILDRYILQKFLTTFVFMVLLIVAVVLAIDFAEKLDDFIEKKAPLDQVLLRYYLNYAPFIANLLTPICVFLAVIFVTSKLTQDTETTAILCSGVSFYRFLAPYLVGAGLLAAGSFYLNGYLVPRAMRDRMEFDYTYLKQATTFEGRNIHRKIAPNGYVYFESFDSKTLTAYMPTLERFDDQDNLLEKIEAQRMQWHDSLKRWTLYEVRTRTIAPGKGHQLGQQTQLDTTILLTPDDILKRDNYTKTLDLNELQDKIALERLRGSDFLNDLILERHERFAYPFAAPILTLLGVSLSTKKRRGGIARQIGVGLILTFIYIFVLVIARGLAGDSFPPGIAVWVPNALFGALALLLIRLAPK